MKRCKSCFNFEDYCTCERSERVILQPQTNSLILPEGYNDPKLYTGFYL